MDLPLNGWKNKNNTAERTCSCGSWKNHSGKQWPKECCVADCHNFATLGAHIYNSFSGDSSEYIVPACDSCNQNKDVFSLKQGTILVHAIKD